MSFTKWCCKYLGWTFVLGMLSTPCQAEGTVGVVLMHGKWGEPGKHISSLAGTLSRAGFLVETPEMPWSKSRQYDKSYEEAMKEIDAAFDRLKAKGATVLVVAGHSLGANAALGYAAARPSLAGVVALAPGHVPELPKSMESFHDSVEKARKMVAEGKGEDMASFKDTNQGKIASITVRARIYVSYFAPDGPAVMTRNTASIQGGAPLLWAVGVSDPMYVRGRAFAFDKAPANPKNLYLELSGGHLDTPSLAADQVVAWIKGL